MTQAIRNNLDNMDLKEAAHAGLILQRYLKVQKSDQSGNEAIEEWENHFETAIHASSAAGKIYKNALHRWEKSFSHEKAHAGAIFKTENRLVCGLGIASPTETGLTLHHTYGIPYIPGSSLKGLASNYCISVLSKTDPSFAQGGETFNILFGDTESEGHITFHDGWIRPRGTIHKDILTPHHSDYNGTEGAKASPSDFDAPVPVSFLSVSGEFLIVLTCDDATDNGKAWSELAAQILTKALQEWGVGGKTSSGYGRLIKHKSWNPPEPPKVDPYAMGNIVEVTRTRDHKKKKKVRREFLTEDGTICFFTSGSEPPDLDETVPIGGKIKVRIVNKNTDPNLNYQIELP